ncbi:hypothetical protein [Spirillospora albida]|uniref:hypothetical protein n=1 Tax=Spirillospora albida TaxID=58123 RepID=UPI0012F990A6|nr:hypothetical protein [Spirillospora albida]
MRLNRKTFAAGAGAAGLLGLGLGIAVPAAANPSPSPSPSSSAHPHKDHPNRAHPHKWRPRAHALRGTRGVHGEATVKRDDGFRVVTWQRGELTARTGTTLTVRSDDGTTWTWTTTKDTRVRADGAKSDAASLKTGTEITVFGDRSGDTRTATFVRTPRKR